MVGIDITNGGRAAGSRVINVIVPAADVSELCWSDGTASRLDDPPFLRASRGFLGSVTARGITEQRADL